MEKHRELRGLVLAASPAAAAGRGDGAGANARASAAAGEVGLSGERAGGLRSSSRYDDVSERCVGAEAVFGSTPFPRSPSRSKPPASSSSPAVVRCGGDIGGLSRVGGEDSARSAASHSFAAAAVGTAPAAPGGAHAWPAAPLPLRKPPPIRAHERPKSVSLMWPEVESKTFSGLRSR